MDNTQPAIRRALAPFAPRPIEPDALQAMRAQAWKEVMQAEAANPSILRALRDQQQDLHLHGELR